jgi:hypothetical protein
MIRLVVFGWIIELPGMGPLALRVFRDGQSSLVDWHAIAPWWIADWLPNIESEIGIALVLAGMIPIYWPPRPQS